jgi:hypothetical protein
MRRACAAAAGVWVFATFFGGGPAVAGALATVKSFVGVGAGGKSPTGGAFAAQGGKGERAKLLSPQQAAGRLTSTFAAP